MAFRPPSSEGSGSANQPSSVPRSGTTLSPRLRHLLIQEDRVTGKLILPKPDFRAPPVDNLLGLHSVSREAEGRHESDVLHTSEGSTSPLARPSSFEHRPSGMLGNGRMLPPPRLSIDRRGSQSIFSLLNNLHVISPTLSTTSTSPEAGRFEPSLPMGSPPSRYPPTPQSAPLPIAHQRSHYPYDNRHSVSGPLPPRPDLFRRHSSHPYEYHPASQPAPFVGDNDLSPSFGSRAPISRTTKACNACRNRKVRCDAGGSESMATSEPSTCSRCREAGIECVYSGAQKKRGPCPGYVDCYFHRISL